MTKYEARTLIAQGAVEIFLAGMALRIENKLLSLSSPSLEEAFNICKVAPFVVTFIGAISMVIGLVSIITDMSIGDIFDENDTEFKDRDRLVFMVMKKRHGKLVSKKKVFYNRHQASRLPWVGACFFMP